MNNILIRNWLHSKYKAIYLFHLFILCMKWEVFFFQPVGLWCPTFNNPTSFSPAGVNECIYKIHQAAGEPVKWGHRALIAGGSCVLCGDLLFTSQNVAVTLVNRFCVTFNPARPICVFINLSSHCFMLYHHDIRSKKQKESHTNWSWGWQTLGVVPKHSGRKN